MKINSNFKESKLPIHKAKTKSFSSEKQDSEEIFNSSDEKEDEKIASTRPNDTYSNADSKAFMSSIFDTSMKQEDENQRKVEENKQNEIQSPNNEATRNQQQNFIQMTNPQNFNSQQFSMPSVYVILPLKNQDQSRASINNYNSFNNAIPNNNYCNFQMGQQNYMRNQGVFPMNGQNSIDLQRMAYVQNMRNMANLQNMNNNQAMQMRMQIPQMINNCISNNQNMMMPNYFGNLKNMVPQSVNPAFLYQQQNMRLVGNMDSHCQ